MATDVDLAFLRLLMREGLLEHPQAQRCLQALDERMRRGAFASASDVVRELGLVDPQRLAEVSERLSDQLMTSVEDAFGPARSFDESGLADAAASSAGGGAEPPREPSGPATSLGVRRTPAGADPELTMQEDVVLPLPETRAGEGRARTDAEGGADSERRNAELTMQEDVVLPLPQQAASANPELTMQEESVLPLPSAGAARGPAPPPAPDERFADLAPYSIDLESYELGPKIARGVTGTTYAGRRKTDGAAVVVKVLSRGFHQDPRLLARVLADLRSWQGLAHPRLGATLAVGSFKDRQAAVFERLPGRTLQDVLRERGRLDVPLAVSVVQQLAQGLGVAHARGLAAGDVRAAKVYLEGQEAALTDLGLAGAAAYAAGFGALGVPFGHPDALAPEVLSGRLDAPTPAGDVYGLGVLLYQLLCGRLPFRGEAREVLRQHRDAPVPPPPPQAGVNVALADVLVRMLAKTPEARLPDAEAVAHALGDLLARGAATAVRPEVPAPLSAAEWTQTSRQASLAGPADRWSAARIAAAPAAGIDVAASMERGQSSGRLPRGGLEEGVAAGEGAARVVLGPKLGRGSVGATYEGHLGDRPVVVKVVSSKFRARPDIVTRLEEAVRAAAEVDHPALVRPLQVTRTQGRLLLVYERRGAQTLREALAFEGPRAPEEAAERVRELAEGLAAAAAAGLHHGDVRPAKVLLDAAGSACLADLGHAEAACLGGGFGAAGLPFGHPQYLAPEVLQEGLKAPDERTDVYALGVLFYELVCGRPPFHSDDPRQVLLQHLEQPLPPPPADRAVPGPIAQLILRMCAKAPDQRPSFAEVTAALTEEDEDQDALLAAALAEASEPEEFDPTHTRVSRAAWGQLVSEAAASVGGAPGAPAASAREGGLGAAISAASAERAGAASARPAAPRGEVDRGRLARAALALAVVVGMMVGAASLDDEPAGPEGAGASASPTPTPSPRPDGGRPESIDALVRAQLANYGEDVRAALERRDFDAALRLEAELDPRVRGAPEARARLAEIQGEVAEALRRHVDERLPEVERHVAMGELGEAAEQVKALRAWSPDEPSLVALAGSIERQVRAREEQVRSLQVGERFDDGAAERLLGERLSGWREGGRLYPGGGVTLLYTRPERSLTLDLQVAFGEAPQADDRGLRLVSRADAPSLLLLPLPLARLVDVTVDLVLASEPPPGARLALVAGPSPEGLVGHGLSWGLTPVELRERELIESNPRPRPPLGMQAPVRLVVRGQDSSLPGRVSLSGDLIDLREGVRHQGATGVAPAGEAAGWLGIYVRGVDVVVTRFEVRGLLDPDGLR